MQTRPGKSWNAILRFYAPLQAWFDKRWRVRRIAHPRIDGVDSSAFMFGDQRTR